MSGRSGAAAVALFAALLGSACRNPLGPRYEYAEELYLGVDGSANVIIESSIPALVALRGIELDPAPTAPVDRERIRDVFEAGGCQVHRVGQPWRRDGRRYVQIRLATADANTLSSCRYLDWSTYRFERDGEQLIYRQTVGPPTPGHLKQVNWRGGELVAFRLHLPSRIHYHNVRRLSDGETGSLERGNILTWEQRLVDRRAGFPVRIEVNMAQDSILYRTLVIFAVAFAGAIAVLGGVVWWTARVKRVR